MMISPVLVNDAASDGFYLLPQRRLLRRTAPGLLELARPHRQQGGLRAGRAGM